MLRLEGTENQSRCTRLPLLAVREMGTHGTLLAANEVVYLGMYSPVGK